MSKRYLSIVGFAMAMTVLHGQDLLAASTVVVGTCLPGQPSHTSTIQAAVNSVSVGGTVLVCPGAYPEQVEIAKPLTLQGVADGTAMDAVITVPLGGLVATFTTAAFGPAAAQLLVRDTRGVSVQDLAVDGIGATCPTGVNRTSGIKLYSAGDPSSVSRSGVAQGGSVRNVVVRNQLACGGVGIDSENSYVTIDSNEIHDVAMTGIVQTGGNNMIVSNTIQNGVYGITVSGANKGFVLYNVTSTARGLVLDGGTTGVLLSLNNVGPWVGIGIFLDSVSGNTVSLNRVNASYAGVWLYNSARNNVKGNRFAYGHFGVANEHSRGGNVITGNMVIEADFGVYHDSLSGGDTYAPNGFVTVKVTKTTNPF